MHSVAQSSGSVAFWKPITAMEYTHHVVPVFAHVINPL